MTRPRDFVFHPRITRPDDDNGEGDYFWVIDCDDDDRVYGCVQRVLLRSSVNQRGHLSTVYRYFAYRPDGRILAAAPNRTPFATRTDAARELRVAFTREHERQKVAA